MILDYFRLLIRSLFHSMMSSMVVPSCPTFFGGMWLQYPPVSAFKPSEIFFRHCSGRGCVALYDFKEFEIFWAVSGLTLLSWRLYCFGVWVSISFRLSINSRILGKVGLLGWYFLIKILPKNSLKSSTFWNQDTHPKSKIVFWLRLRTANWLVLNKPNKNACFKVEGVYK